MAAMFIRNVRIPSFKVAALLLGLLFFYDIFWVFFSARIFGNNVMVYVAQGLDLPIKLECPHFNPGYVQNQCSMLGLGDIVLPGLVIAFCYRFDSDSTSNYLGRKKYFTTAVVSYMTALVLCGVVLSIFGHAQPVLLYISPLMIGSIAFIGHKSGELNKVWTNSPVSSRIIGLTLPGEEELLELDSRGKAITEEKDM